MPITDKLYRLGHSAERLNAGSDRLTELISRIDAALALHMIGLEYVHPAPLREVVHFDAQGKRVIELAFLGYLKVEGSFHLAIKTVKILESKLQVASEAPGTVMALVQAPRVLRHQAVDALPDLVAGLAAVVDDVVSEMERRCAVAEALVQHLESLGEPRRGAGPVADPGVGPRPSPSPSPVGAPGPGFGVWQRP